LHQIIEDEFKEKKIENYSFQYEPHKSGETHLQGCHNYRSRRPTERNRFTALGFDDKYPVITYCEGVACPGSVFDYCQKEERVCCPDCKAEGPWIGGEKPLANRDLTREDLEKYALKNRPWSEEVFEMCRVEPPVVHNKVYWYWSRDSGVGKNNLQRHLTIEFGAIPLDMQKASHSLGLVYKNPARVYTINVPRERYYYVNKSGDKVFTPLNYRFLETLSDMYFQASFGTEMTGAVVRKASWILVFANEPPTGEFVDSGRVIPQEIGSDFQFVKPCGATK
jgi:hypothetical protein